MKSTSELTNREKYPNKLITNKFGSIVVNEQIDCDYFIRKVEEYIWVVDINKLAASLRKSAKFKVQTK